MRVKPKIIPKAVSDKGKGKATPERLGAGDYNVPGGSIGDGELHINEWQQLDDPSKLDDPSNWYATADVKLDSNGEATIPLEIFDDNVVEGNETITWTISKSAPFGFEQKTYKFGERDTEIDIPLSEESSDNKTLTITIKDNDLSITGDDDDNELDGGKGSDIIVGGLGSDTLTGGDDDDKFVFNSPSDGIDTITDFTSYEDDKIQVSASGFGIGETEYNRFIYNSSAGALFFDQTQLASLQLDSDFNPSVDITIF